MKKPLLQTNLSYLKKFRPLFLLCFQMIMIGLLTQQSACAHFILDYKVNMYLNQYKDIAINEMKRTGIPASIKIAQGMLESSYGTSQLAIDANNHFGIKCKSYWQGDTYLYDDDQPDECFRKYNSAIDSYTDHSEFLRYHRDGYFSNLFLYGCTDYISWAFGLQNLGYATDTNYAVKLIGVIQKYELYNFDCISTSGEIRKPENLTATVRNQKLDGRRNTINTPEKFIPNSNNTNNLTPLSVYATQIPPAQTTNSAKTEVYAIPKNKIEPLVKPVADFNATNVKQENINLSNNKNPEARSTSSSKKESNQSNKKTKPVPDFIACPTCEVKPLKTSEPKPQNNRASDNKPNNPIEKPETNSLAPTTTNSTYAIPVNELNLTETLINGIHAIIANKETNLYEVAQKKNLKLNKLEEYNEVQSHVALKAGTPIFLGTKKQKSIQGLDFHVVKFGQTLYEVSQEFGLKLKSLCKLNNLEPDTQLKELTILKLN